MTTRAAMIAATLPLAFVLGAKRPLHYPYTIGERLSVSVALGDSLRHLLRTPHSGFPFALRAVAGDSPTFRKLWAEAVGRDPGARPVPQIDFERNMAVVAAMGSMRSTGFTITIDSVVVRGPFVDVHVVLGSAGSLCIQGPAMTNPVDIVVVARSAATVTFRDTHITVECKIP